MQRESARGEQSQKTGDQAAGVPGKSFARGVGLNALSTIIRIVCQIGSVVVLSRFLDPADFGRSSPAVALCTFIAIFAEFGFGSSLIQARNYTEDLAFSCLCYVVVIALAISGGMIVFREGIYHLLDYHNFNLILLMCVIVTATPLASVLESINARNFRFKIDFLANTTSIFFGYLVLPLVLALFHWGFWSVVVGQAAVQAIRIAIYIPQNMPRPRTRLEWQGVLGIINFAGFFTMQRVMNAVSLQGDRVALASSISEQQLGFYSRSQDFSQIIIMMITSSFDRVVFPFIANIQNDVARTVKFYRMAIHGLSILLAFAAVSACVLSQFIIRLLLGEKWISMASIAALFSCLIFIRPMNILGMLMLRSSAMVRVAALMQALLALWTVSCCFLFQRYGLEALAATIVCGHALTLVGVQFAVCLHLRMPLRAIAKDMAPGALTAAILYALFALSGVVLGHPQGPIGTFVQYLGAAVVFLPAFYLVRRVALGAEIAATVDARFAKMAGRITGRLRRRA